MYMIRRHTATIERYEHPQISEKLTVYDNIIIIVIIVNNPFILQGYVTPNSPPVCLQQRK